MEPSGQSTEETLRKMRSIVALGDPGACGEGCLEDALSRVVYGRSWWCANDEYATERELERMEAVYQKRLEALPLYQQLLQRGKELNPTRSACVKLWGLNDQISKMQRIDIIDSLLRDQ